MIEDCAHVLSPGTISKWVGDFLVFSPHKHFPVSSVGMAFRHHNQPQIEDYLPGRMPCLWMLRSLVKTVFPKRGGAVYRIVFNGCSQQLPRNKVSKNLIAAVGSFLTNSRAIAHTRKRNYTLIKQVLETLPGWKVSNQMTGLHFPYLLGFVCESSSLAKSRFAALNEGPQVAMMWPDLPEEINRSPEILNFCEDRVERTLFFFIHQGLDIKAVLDHLKKSINVKEF